MDEKAIQVLYGRVVGNVNDIVVAPIAKERREDMLARLGAFVEARLEQVMAEKEDTQRSQLQIIEPKVSMDAIPEVVETMVQTPAEEDDDLSFLD